MKRLMYLVLCCALMGSACGSSSDENVAIDTPDAGESSPSEVAEPAEDANDASLQMEENSELPTILDAYDDDLFRYEDKDLYIGSYLLTEVPQETCSQMLGIEMPDAIEAQITSAALSFFFDGSQRAFSLLSENEGGPYDMWSYVGTIADITCVAAFSSAPQSTMTLEFFGLGCDDLSGAMPCASLFQRTADYDFSQTVIKEVGGASDPHGYMQEALQDLLLEQAR